MSRRKKVKLIRCKVCGHGFDSASKDQSICPDCTDKIIKDALNYRNGK